MSLTNPNTPVSQQDLQDFYHKILPYMGGSFEMVANKFSKGDLYSTDEKMIGQWVDGKPLYQKVVKCEELPNNTSKTYSYNISNVDKFVSVYAVGINTTSLQTIPIPYIHNNTVYTMYYWVSDAIYVTTGADRSSYDGYFFLRYTKSTDTAVSIGEATEYSTTEKIVGTWIDGKPLYQIVLTATTPSTANSIAQVVEIPNYSNISKIVSLNSYTAIEGNKSIIAGNYYEDSNAYIVVWINSDRIKMKVSSVYTSKNISFVLQYTKTT